ncbi:MAG TPA: hypothetical protein VIW45_17450 [Vicinamibacterales bacterium]|jgi:predicted RNase H-like HicB family nuclease
MSAYFPMVVEREASGTWSAWVAGLPVYAQGATARAAERALRSTFEAYLTEHPNAVPKAHVKVMARANTADRPHVTVLSTAALLGRRTSARKAAAARANGRLGGRPRLTR